MALDATSDSWNKPFKVGFCQTSVSATKSESLAHAKAAVAEAVSKGAQLVIIGEMFSCPYATKFFREYGERLPIPDTVAALLKKSRATPDEMMFEEVLACVEGAFTYRAVPFVNGDVSSKAGENAGSAKVFSFGKLLGLGVDDTLALFGQHYRDVKSSPDGKSHGNIRAFMKTGWDAVSFPSGLALYSIPVTSADNPSIKMLADLAREHKIWLVGGSVPELEGDEVYNTCLVFTPDGAIAAKHRKVHLFDIDVAAADGRPAIKFKESDVLTAGDQLTLVDLPWCRAGVGICYDVRFPEYALALRNRGAKLLLYPGAFNMNTGPAHWSLLARGRANDAQCYVAMVSPARSANKDDYQAWGHSMMASPWAEVLVEMEHEPGVQVVEVTPSEVDRIRASVPTSNQKRGDLYVPYADGGDGKRLKTD